MSTSITAINSQEVPSSIRLGIRVTNALNGCFLFNLFDDAISDLFCLRSYTHGTSRKCYISIMRMGADPTHGGKGGECGLYAAFGRSHDEAANREGKTGGWDCKRRFFVFLPECYAPMKRWVPRVYSIVACVGKTALSIKIN